MILKCSSIVRFCSRSSFIKSHNTASTGPYVILFGSTCSCVPRNRDTQARDAREELSFGAQRPLSPGAPLSPAQLHMRASVASVCMSLICMVQSHRRNHAPSVADAVCVGLAAWETPLSQQLTGDLTPHSPRYNLEEGIPSACTGVEHGFLGRAKLLPVSGYAAGCPAVFQLHCDEQAGFAASMLTHVCCSCC